MEPNNYGYSSGNHNWSILREMLFLSLCFFVVSDGKEKSKLCDALVCTRTDVDVRSSFKQDTMPHLLGTFLIT